MPRPKSTTAAKWSAFPETAIRPSAGSPHNMPCCGKTARSLTSEASAASLGTHRWQSTNKGDVVGFSDLSGDQSGGPNFHAFLWTKSGGMNDLGTLPGDAYSEALGHQRGGADRRRFVRRSFSTSRAFIWENGTMVDLNSLISPSSSALSALRQRHQRPRRDRRRRVRCG